VGHLRHVDLLGRRQHEHEEFSIGYDHHDLGHTPACDVLEGRDLLRRVCLAMLAHLVGSVLRIEVLPEPFEPAHAFLLRSPVFR
jgi:hypothetical protein